jgi:hypothetical protein
MKTRQRKKNHDITNMVGAGLPKAKIVKSTTSEIWKKSIETLQHSCLQLLYTAIAA